MKISYLHLSLQKTLVLFANRLIFRFHLNRNRTRNCFLSLALNFTELSLVRSNHIFLYFPRLLKNNLLELNNWVRSIGTSRSFQFCIEQNAKKIFQLSIFLQNHLPLLKSSKLSTVDTFNQLRQIQSLLQFRFSENLRNNILSDHILQTVTQTSFNILATHRYNLCTSLSHQRVSTHSSLH